MWNLPIQTIRRGRCICNSTRTGWPLQFFVGAGEHRHFTRISQRCCLTAGRMGKKFSKITKSLSVRYCFHIRRNNKRNRTMWNLPIQTIQRGSRCICNYNRIGWPLQFVVVAAGKEFEWKSCKVVN